MLALGRLINQHELYQIPGTFGLYSSAKGAETRNDARGRAASVAGNIQTTTRPTLSSIYLTKLNLAAKLSNKDELKQRDIETPLQKLSDAYSKLRVKSAEKVPLNQNPSAFERLWQARDEVALNSAISSFQTAFQSVGQPKQAIQFLTNWIEAAAQVPSLQAELQNPKFLDQWMQLGITIAQLNLEQAKGGEPLWSFVETLWRSNSAGELRLGASQLQEFFQEAKTPEQRLKLVQFSDNLLQAAKLAPSTQGQVKDPRFVDALLGLGGAYAALGSVMNEVEEGNTAIQEGDYFLKVLWLAKNEQQIEQGSQELHSFINDFPANQALAVLGFERDVLKAVGQELQGKVGEFPIPPLEWNVDDEEILSDEVLLASIGPGDWNPPGNQPIRYYIGNEAHKGIARVYENAHPGDVVRSNFVKISKILDDFELLGWKVDRSSLSKEDLDARPDILNASKPHIYEIKSYRSLQEGRREVKYYANILAKAKVGVPFGPKTEPGTRGVIPAPGGYYVFASPEDGVIIYRYRRGSYEGDPKNVTREELLRYINNSLVQDDVDALEREQLASNLAKAALILFLLYSLWRNRRKLKID